LSRDADLVKQYNKPYTYPPDTLVNNEIGWKTEWFDHRLLVNGSAYIMIGKRPDADLQPARVRQPLRSRGGTRLSIKGAELQIVRASPTA